MLSPEDGEEFDDCWATMLAATLLPFATTSGFVQYVGPEELVSEPDSLGAATSSACVCGALDGPQTTLSIDTARSS